MNPRIEAMKRVQALANAIAHGGDDTWTFNIETRDEVGLRKILKATIDKAWDGFPENPTLTTANLPDAIMEKEVAIAILAQHQKKGML